MNLNDIINQIIDIPSKFYELKNVSIYSLLEESGYFEVREQINEANIFAAVNNNPEVVKKWMQLSEDKRTDSGWYFTNSGNDQYVVGYYPENEFTAVKYYNVSEACADFIIRKIGSIR